MTKSTLNRHLAIRIGLVTACLIISPVTTAERVTEPVPSSAPMDPDLRAKMRTGNLGSTLQEMVETEKRFMKYAETAPGDFTKNGDIPEYDVTVAGQNHFRNFLEDLFNPTITDWETQVKLPQGCRWIPNPPALYPVIPPNAAVSAPVHISQWRVISCAGKMGGAAGKGRMKSWTAFVRFYNSVTSASVAEATAMVRNNLAKAGYKEPHWRGYTGECDDNHHDMCLIFYNHKKHANVYPTISRDSVPSKWINHPEYITKYAPMFGPLKEYLHKSPQLTSIDIIEFSQTPLDTPAIPIRGLDTAVDGIPGNPGAKRDQ